MRREKTEKETQGVRKDRRGRKKKGERDRERYKKREREREADSHASIITLLHYFCYGN